MATYKISPSDLTFLWDGCPFCFYMKVRHNIAYKGPFPGIFSTMGALTSDYYMNGPSSALSSDLPGGVITHREGWVKSQPIQFPGLQSKCYISGRFDAIITFEDASYGIVDFKTASASAEKADFYRPQLAAYAYALEHPAPGALSLSPVTRLGLFIITPSSFEELPSGEPGFGTRSTWMEVSRDEPAFLAFLSGIMAVLEMPEPPQSAATCPLCQYRQDMRGFNEGATDPIQPILLD